MLDAERSLYRDRQGRPIDLATWHNFSMTTGYRRVESTVLEDGKWICTVWIGLHTVEYNPETGDWNGPPLIFETTIFDRKWDFLDDNYEILGSDEYPTEEAAIQGHTALVEKWTDHG